MDDLNEILSDLSRNWTNAKNQLADTASRWRDNKGIEFKRRYWANFDSEVPRFIETLQAITTAIRESKRKFPG